MTKGRKPKLTKEDADDVRDMYQRMSISQIAHLFRVSTATIHKVLDRKRPYERDAS